MEEDEEKDIFAGMEVEQQDDTFDTSASENPESVSNLLVELKGLKTKLETHQQNTNNTITVVLVGIGFFGMFIIGAVVVDLYIMRSEIASEKIQVIVLPSESQKTFSIDLQESK